MQAGYPLTTIALGSSGGVWRMSVALKSGEP